MQMELMALIYQLNPHVLVKTPLGMAEANYIIEYGNQQRPCWIVTLVNGGIVKHFDANDIVQSSGSGYQKNLIRYKDLARIETKLR